MSAVPKSRRSRSKVRMHRNHQKMKLPASTECSHCHEIKLPHRVCPNCGYYNGMEIISQPEK
ncbi:50S ribosomal protein L32 [Candidatus Bipolaricaulota bacterium]|nr:50S ribosomal protein L32 [Candidatus Bipolaricaulota bacterium]